MDIIKTDRLILRKWKIEDAKSMYNYAKDKDVGPIAGWPLHKSIDESKEIINHFINNCPYCYAICLNNDINNPIGCIELKLSPSDLATKEDECELGYWLGKPFWGLGYMPEACKALIDYAFNVLNFNIVWCGYYDGNNKSKRVQEKLGFIYHHTTNDLLVKALNEKRIGHANYMTKEIWNKNRG